MIFAYHEVDSSRDSGYTVTCRQFEDHLRVITNCGGPHARHGLITFDDGELSQYSNALPLLEKHGVKAAFFVNVGLIGRSEILKGWKQSFMDWPQLNELVRLGHRVQSHGWSHEFLTGCTEAELDRQLQKSRQTLEDGLGAPVDSISVPGGRWNSRVLQACHGAGYRAVFTSDPWVCAAREGVTVTGRYMVRRNTDALRLQHLLNLRPAELLRMRIAGQIKSGIRSLLGERLYHALWRQLVRT